MVAIEKVAYHGWSNCIKVSNNLIELIVLTDVGPRIIHLAFKGGENLLYENKEDAGQTGGDKWRTYGGHRLWHAPEDIVRTYVPDNFPVQVKLLKDGARFTAPVEANGIQKIVEIHLSESEAKVKVNHTMVNRGLWPIPLSMWALTVMKAGGKVIVPHPPKISHDDRLIPTHTLTLWGFTKMDDPRWIWGDKYYSLKQDSSLSSCQKIGSLNTFGWAAYQNGSEVFIKKFGYNPSFTYPDMNCNFETYTDQNMLEVETLGPMVEIAPGQKSEHLEEWSLHKGIKPSTTDAEIDKNILPLLQA
ncbi:MAG: hypothetical protein C0410_02215 [Anaerolinea sp.]|nr:hypothetical protein [Anaerolinea sp.]